MSLQSKTYSSSDFICGIIHYVQRLEKTRRNQKLKKQLSCLWIMRLWMFSIFNFFTFFWTSPDFYQVHTFHNKTSKQKITC